MSVYELVMVDSLGQERSLFYDPHTSTLERPRGTPYIEDKEQKKFSPVKRTSPENPGRKSKIAKRLRIQMGLKCNKGCSYCSQTIHVGDAKDTITADAKIFLKNVRNWFWGKPDKIEFWGGEPLLYWNKIKLLVEGLAPEYPDTQFIIITNGTLIDEEFIDYVEKYNIGVGISHDGPCQHLRGDDWNDEQVEVIRALLARRPGMVSFNSVITPASHDVIATIDYFKDRFGPDAKVEFEGVVSSYSHGDDSFTEAQYQVMRDSIVKLVARHQSLGTIDQLPHSIISKMKDFVLSLKYGRPSYAVGQKCGMDREDTIAIDLLGNVMTCQNTGSEPGGHRIGHASQMADVKLDTSWHWSHRDECRECPVLQTCKGACMYLPEGPDWFTTCTNEYHYNMAMMAGALFCLTGWVLKEVKGRIARPDPAMLYQAADITKKPVKKPAMYGRVWELKLLSDGSYSVVKVYDIDSSKDKVLVPEGDVVLPEALISGLEDPVVQRLALANIPRYIRDGTPVIRQVDGGFLWSLPC